MNRRALGAVTEVLDANDGPESMGDATMTEQSEAIGVLAQVGIDVSDLTRAEDFYSELLGLRRAEARDQYLNFEPLPGGLTLYLQRVPEKKSSKTRVHLDVVVKDMPAALARVEALGGKRMGSFLEEGEGWTVITDPDDNELCLLQG